MSDRTVTFNGQEYKIITEEELVHVTAPQHGTRPDLLSTPTVVGGKGGAVRTTVGDVMESEAAMDRLSRGVRRIPLTAAEGAGQVVSMLADLPGRIGMINPVTSKRLPTDVTERYMEAVQSGRRGDLPGYQAVKSNTEANVSTLGAGALLSPQVKAATWLGAVGKNSLAAAAGQASMYDPEAQTLLDKAPEVALAAGLAGAVSSVASMRQAQRNYMGKAAGEGMQKTGMAKIAPELEPFVGGGFSLAQYTGIPYLKTLENVSYNSQAVQFYTQQTKNIIAGYVDRMAKNLTSPLQAEAKLLRAKGIAEGTIDDLDQARTTLWREGTREAAAIGRKAPGVDVATASFNEELQALLGNVRRTDVTPLGAAHSPLTRIAASDPAVAHLVTRLSALSNKGGASLQDYAVLLKSTEELKGALNRGVMTHTVGENEAELIYGKLRSAIDDDIKGMAANAASNPRAKPMYDAVERLMETRRGYEHMSNMIAGTKSASVQQLFGSGGPVGLDGIYAQFKTFTPSAQRQVMDFLDSSAPEVIDGLKRAAINDATLTARRAGGDAAMIEAPYDLKKFHESLVSGEAKTLWSAKELDAINKQADAIRAVFNNRPPLKGAGTPILGQDIGSNLVSGNPIFLSRQLFRFFQGTQASKIMFDPVVYKELLKIKNTSGPTQWLTVAGLNAYLTSHYGEVE